MCSTVCAIFSYNRKTVNKKMLSNKCNSSCIYIKEDASELNDGDPMKSIILKDESASTGRLNVGAMVDDLMDFS